MTNVKHAQMIDIIGKMDSPLLGVHKDRCMLVRNRNAECLRCAAVCTTGAISRSDAGVEVDPDLCIGCGTCASACPTCCLEAKNPSDEELFDRAQMAIERNGGTLPIACSTLLRSAGIAQEAACSVRLPNGLRAKLVPVVCLGRVEESLMIESAARGARTITLLHGSCETCTHRAGGELSESLCESARELLAVVGRSIAIERKDMAESGMTIELASEPLSNGRAQNPCDSRAEACFAEPLTDETPSTSTEQAARERARRAFAHDRNARTALVPGYDKDFTSKFVHVQADGTLPHHVPSRRLRLYNSLKRMGASHGSQLRSRLWGHVSIDVDICRSCRMCTVFCPTGALSRFDEPNDVFGVDHRSTLCMQCRMCEAICPERAITVSDSVDVEDFLTGRIEHIELQPVGWNPGGEDAIATCMTRLMKVDAIQDPQAKMKPEEVARQRSFSKEKEARRKEIRAESAQQSFGDGSRPLG